MSFIEVHAPLMLVSRRVKPGCEQDFERVCTAMMEDAARYPGYRGSQLVRPGEEKEVDDDLFHVILAFDSQAHLQGWQVSEARARGLTALQPFVDGAHSVRHLSGLAHWFQSPARAPIRPPPRWKVAIVTWLGICPTVYAGFLLFGPLMTDWSLLPRVVFLTVFVVSAMTWIIAPQLTRLLAPWLYKSSVPAS